jgi:F0F1-type ATP synthase membrane subunit c/vacuolar-type H+-ATPase subunit K
MDPLVTAASVLGAGLAIGLGAIGPELDRVMLLDKLLLGLHVNPKLKERFAVRFS